MTNLDKNTIIHLLRGYNLLKKVLKYPEIKDIVVDVFLEALQKEKGLDEHFFVQMAKEIIEVNKNHFDQKDLEQTLIFIYFTISFKEDIWEEYINLARKKLAFKELSRVVNKEGATYGQIMRSVKKFCEIPEGDMYLSPSEVEGIRVALINFFISNQLSFISIAKEHITVRDVNDILDRTYRSKRRPGRIGGKAAGMYLAYRILKPRFKKTDPILEKHIEIPESYFFNSGIFSEFIDYNELYEFHSQKYKTIDEIQKGYEKIALLFKNARFPDDMLEMFREFLNKVGEHPLILRSSSLLEDNFGYAFSGKYDSVFLANQGNIESRLDEFIWGLKKVHMSTYSPAAIIYRRDHNLLDFDEKMSVLAQKVIGRRFGKYFLPFAAGVGFSYSTYSWSPKIDKNQGMIRLVFGLGTRAVDRVGGDYPRMIFLSHPGLRPEISASDIMKYSQKYVDVIDLEQRKFLTIPLSQFLKQVKHPDMFYAISIAQGDHLTTPLSRIQKIDVSNSCITFENFINKTKFIPLIKEVLNKLEKAYKRPVDVEFAWDQDKLYILQCRSLSVTQDPGHIEIPDNISKDDIIFTTHRVLNNCKVQGLELVIYVDPKSYSLLNSVEDKIKLGKIIGKLNRELEDKNFALFGPGRWGSNDINLGVKVNYEDINHAKVLAEVAFEQNGCTPEVSFGTHFFSDLVEANIIPIAIFPNDSITIFKEEFFLKSKNILTKLMPKEERFKHVIHVIDVPKTTNGKTLNIYQDSIQQYGIGFLK